MSILAWIVLGIVAGAIVAALNPDDPGGPILLGMVGIVGAFMGGFIGNALTNTGFRGFSIWGIVFGILGAIALLYIYRFANRSRRF